jgi:hypothetical protein
VAQPVLHDILEQHPGGLHQQIEGYCQADGTEKAFGAQMRLAYSEVKAQR